MHRGSFAGWAGFVLTGRPRAKRWTAALGPLLAVIVAAAPMCLAGCGSDGGTRLPVTGSVSFHGQPLSFGTIEFQSSKAVGGGPIADGVFHIPAEHGLPPGVYQVTISAIRSPAVMTGPPGPDAKDAGEEILPPEFNVKCDKTVEVRRGATNQFDFDIP